MPNDYDYRRSTQSDHAAAASSSRRHHHRNTDNNNNRYHAEEEGNEQQQQQQQRHQKVDSRSSGSHQQSYKRERSRSPPSSSLRQRDEEDDARARREAQRRAEMERLRAENDEEERRFAALDRKGDKDGTTSTTMSTTNVQPQEEIVAVNEAELEWLDEEEQMRKLLGIEGFGTTKGQKVDSNHNSLASGAANKNKARKYRQYMNRVRTYSLPLPQAGGSWIVACFCVYETPSPWKFHANGSYRLWPTGPIPPTLS